jgi:hypothetical protein
MHQLRLFEMLVGRETTVNKYYDFKFGKSHLRGYGWQGLVALGILLTPLVFVTGIWILHQINHLFGI